MVAALLSLAVLGQFGGTDWQKVATMERATVVRLKTGVTKLRTNYAYQRDNVTPVTKATVVEYRLAGVQLNYKMETAGDKATAAANAAEPAADVLLVLAQQSEATAAALYAAGNWFAANQAYWKAEQAYRKAESAYRDIMSNHKGADGFYWKCLRGS